MFDESNIKKSVTRFVYPQFIRRCWNTGTTKSIKTQEENTINKKKKTNEEGKITRTEGGTFFTIEPIQPNKRRKFKRIQPISNQGIKGVSSHWSNVIWYGEKTIKNFYKISNNTIRIQNMICIFLFVLIILFSALTGYIIKLTIN